MIRSPLDSAVETPDLTITLAKYEEAEAGNLKAYKFTILHISHFLELLFKHFISQKHKLLIYRNPFAQNLDKNNTITFWDAVNFISHETGEIEQNSQFRRDLEWLKRLRNDIEHYRFEMDVKEARETIGRIFAAVCEFFDFFSDLKLADYVPEELTNTFQILSDEYEMLKSSALKEAEEAEKTAYLGVRPKERSFVEFARYDCPECGIPTMIPNGESSSGYRCTLCGNEDSSEIEVSCDLCGSKAPEDEMELWPLENGTTEYRCYYCSGRYHLDKDND